MEPPLIASPKVIYFEGTLGSGVTKAFNEISKRLYNKGWSIIRLFDDIEIDIRSAPDEYFINLIKRVPSKVHVNTLFLGGPIHLIVRLFWNQAINNTENTEYPCLDRCIKNMYNLLPGLTVFVVPVDLKDCLEAVRSKKLFSMSGEKMSAIASMRLHLRYREISECLKSTPNVLIVKSSDEYIPNIYHKITKYWRQNDGV